MVLGRVASWAEYSVEPLVLSRVVGMGDSKAGKTVVC